MKKSPAAHGTRFRHSTPRATDNESKRILELRTKSHKNRRHAAPRTESRQRSRKRFSTLAGDCRDSEEKLRKCDQLLKDIQRITHLGNWEWEIRSNTLTWSDELYRIFGLNSETFEPTYEKYLERVHLEDRDRVRALVETSLKSGQPFTSEHRIIRPDGSLRFLETHGEVIVDGQNQPARMLGCCLDITPRKEIEQKLTTSLSLLHATLESTADGILVVNLSGNLSSYNQNFIEMWKMPLEMMESYEDRRALSNAFEQLKDPEGFMAKVNYLYEHPEQESFDVLEFKDGRIFERFSKPQKIGKAIVGRVWSFRDVTEQRRAEEAITRKRDCMEAMINSLPGIFYLLDETGLCLRWNRNLEIVTGYTSSEIAKMNALDFVSSEDRQLLLQRVRKAFSAGHADAKIRLLTKTGERIPYFCTATLLNFDGEQRLVGMGIDISQLQKARDEVRKLNRDLGRRVRERTAQLDATNKELEAFSYSVSHDLRAPLRAIGGFANVLWEDLGDKLGAEGIQVLEKILQASDRMSHLIDDLLNYSRIGRGAIVLHPVSLDGLLRQITNDFALRIQAIGGNLSIADDLPVVLGDATLLGQVFANLFENAITYRKPNVPLTLTVEARKTSGRAIICVSDNGIGIAAQHHERIFEVFQRLHSPQEYPGTGIGLANAKKSIELLGGKIWVESEPGKGSTFCIELKLSPSEPPVD